MTLVWTLEMPPYQGTNGRPAIAMGGDAIMTVESSSVPHRRVVLQSKGVLPSEPIENPAKKIEGVLQRDVYISSTRQKITIINPSIVLGWSGIDSQIQTFLGVFRSETTNEDFHKYSDLSDVLARIKVIIETARYYLLQELQAHDDFASEETIDVHFVGFIHWGGGHVAVGYKHERQSGPFGLVGQAAGTGSPEYFQYLQSRLSADNLTQVAGHFHGLLLLREVQCLSMSQMKDFGGFFELVELSDNGFAKLDRVLTVIMRSTGKRPRPEPYARYCYQFYDEEILYACVFEPRTASYEVVAIPSFGSVLPETEYVPSFVPKYMLFMVLLFDENDEPYEHFQQLYAVGARETFRFPTEPFTMDEQTGRLQMEDWYLNGMEEGARQRLAAHWPTEASDMVDAAIPHQQIDELVRELKTVLGQVISRNVQGKDTLTHLPIVSTALIATMSSVFVELGRSLRASSPEAYEAWIRAIPPTFAENLYKESGLPTVLR